VAEPLLRAKDVRIDVGGVPRIDGLTAELGGSRGAVLGAARALFEAAAGLVPTASGKLTVLGHEPRAALAKGVLASAPLDPPLPPKWTAQAYATWCARLAGHDAREARARADAALRALSVADAPLEKAPLLVRRGGVLAGALATGADVLVLEDPLAGLRPDEARTLGRAVLEALGEKAWILFAPALPLASPFAMHAEDALVIRSSHPIAQGAPAELAVRERAWAVRLEGNAEAVARALRDAGAEVQGSGERMVVDLPEGVAAAAVVAAAEAAGALVLELLPLGRAVGS
jgi:ABC-type multidrug transport system ATPase subunit